MAFICFMFLLLTLVPMSHSVNYTWTLYPIANQALYGYDQAANKSFKSANVPEAVKTQMEDGIHALHVPAGQEIDLGDFAGTCVSNTTQCEKLSVSFLLKTDGGNKSLKVFDSGIRSGGSEEWGWMFEINARGDYEAMVAHGNSIEAKEMSVASAVGWLHVGFTYDSTQSGSGALELYVNGSQFVGPRSGSSPYPRDRNTHLKLGSKDNSFGFFINTFQFLEMGLNSQEMQKVGNASFVKGMQVYNAAVEALQNSAVVLADAGKVQIPLKRTGGLDVAVAVGFSTTSGTATASKHYVPVTDKQLAFASGETYKQLEIIIVDDETTPGNKTFNITLNSPENWVVLNGPKEVEVTIMYKGGAGAPGTNSSATTEKASKSLLICIVVLFSSFLAM